GSDKGPGRQEPGTAQGWAQAAAQGTGTVLAAVAVRGQRAGRQLSKAVLATRLTSTRNARKGRSQQIRGAQRPRSGIWGSGRGHGSAPGGSPSPLPTPGADRGLPHPAAGAAAPWGSGVGNGVRAGSAGNAGGRAGRGGGAGESRRSQRPHAESAAPPAPGASPPAPSR
ncbi:unnamed protein product, partial [Coccothraustes coccothraustes]